MKPFDRKDLRKQAGLTLESHVIDGRCECSDTNTLSLDI